MRALSRRVRAALLFSLVVVLISACAGIPNTRPEAVSDSLPQVGTSGGVRVVVRPPVAEMDATQAAQGFLAANASQAGDFEIARQYLTATAAATWRPQRVDVYEPTSLEVSAIDVDTVLVRYEVVGQLESNSRLLLNESSVQRELILELQSTSAGLRVVNPISAALMTISDFSRNYSGYRLWFLNADYDSLVADVVWLPASSTATPTRLARLLLAGPSGAMAVSLRTSIPPDTRLAVSAVTVQDRRAQVALTSAALAAAGAQRTAMLAQFTLTLSQLANFVEVSVGSQTLTQGSTSQLRPEDFSSLDLQSLNLASPLFSVSNGVLRRGERNEWRSLWQLYGSVSIAANWDGRLLAVSRGNLVRVFQAASGRLILTGPGRAVDMEFDRDSRLWLARSNGSVSVLEPSGTVRDVVGLLPNESVVGVSPSPDGSRLAVISLTSAGPTLRVYPIVESATQIGLAAPLRVERYFSEVVDVDWLSSAQLLVLARARSEVAEVFLVDQSNLSPTLLAGLSRAVMVTASPGQPPCALSESGRLYCWIGGEWRDYGLSTAVDYAG